jgi:uridine kinase
LSIADDIAQIPAPDESAIENRQSAIVLENGPVPPMSNSPPPLIIGIGGGTGSGKTTVARTLCERYAELGVSLVDLDSYYHDRSHLSPEERARVNYDEPSAIDHDLLLEHLQQLASGQSIEKRRYLFATHTRSAEVDVVKPTPIIIVEGLFALWDPRICSLMGLKLYVNADPDLRFIRRLQRDLAERGRTVESVITQYLQTVRPMHRRYIEATKENADLVVDTSLGSHPGLIEAVDGALAFRFPTCRH